MALELAIAARGEYIRQRKSLKLPDKARGLCSTAGFEASSICSARRVLVPTTTMAAPMFRTQGVVYNAPGVASKTGSIAKSLGATSVFLVTDQMLVSIGMAKIIVDSVEAAGLQCIVFDGVVPNPTVSCINEGIRQLQACAPGTVVVTLGGGSVMDCGKSIAVISAQEKDADVRDFYGQPKLNPKTDTIDLRSMAPQKRPTKLSPRIIAIPTTSGTGR